jgi:hypothetical protein
VPGRLIFHVIKIGRSARAGKETAMENGLKVAQILTIVNIVANKVFFILIL